MSGILFTSKKIGKWLNFFGFFFFWKFIRPYSVHTSSVIGAFHYLLAHNVSYRQRRRRRYHHFEQTISRNVRGFRFDLG